LLLAVLVLGITVIVQRETPRPSAMLWIKEPTQVTIADGNGMVTDVAWAATKIVMREGPWAVVYMGAITIMLVANG